MVITKDNYFQSSYGIFHVIPKSWSERLLQVVGTKTPIRCGNDWFVFQHKSAKTYFNDWGTSESISIYFVSTDNKKLIRISDHWTDNSAMSITSCGRIARCHWKLSGAAAKNLLVHCGQKMAGGLIRFSQLVET